MTMRRIQVRTSVSRPHSAPTGARRARRSSGVSQRQPQRHRRSLSFDAAEVNLATNEVRALAHPEETDGRLPGPLALRDPSPVVSNHQHEYARVDRQRDIDSRGTGVTEDVRQGLLKDSEDGRGFRGIQLESGPGRYTMNGDSSPVLELTRLPFDRLLPPQPTAPDHPQLVP